MYYILFSSGSLAHLRLCAAKVLIKLVCKRKDFSLSLSDFLQLSLVSQVSTCRICPNVHTSVNLYTSAITSTNSSAIC